ncbi:LuxR C-terminal-related transcriptional regulator [Solimonas fluminis]|uniref:LuxR C-terminal-related transcriptional regulator n=1 Tax=Solimonas fluminis TaxID=2086571 RepID=UPI0013FD77C3|nr:response regulator transcription factor [Solimonas fluminis]
MGTTATATVIIADDHPLLRVALRLNIERIEPSAQVIEVDSLAALKSSLPKHPDTRLVLLDLMMPDVEGLSALQYLRHEWPELRVAVVSGMEERSWVRSAEALGAVAFIPKATPVEQTQQILAKVMSGGGWWPPPDTLPPPPPDSIDARIDRLSPQELRILLYIKDGRLNKQIADELAIRESTVKTHITALLRKLDLRSRTQAAVLAQRLLAGN